MRLLLAEDEVELANALSVILKKSNYSVDVFYDGEAALSALNTHPYDAAILDIMMPKMDGLTVLRKIREQGSCLPVLILTAKSETDDKVFGLDLGADDYLTKPFSTKELLARIRAITRRGTDSTDSLLTYGNTSLDTNTFKLKGPLGEVVLVNKEFQILQLLMIRPQNVVSIETLMDKIWGGESDTEQNVVWVYISYIRRKLQTIGSDNIIKAHRNAGYSLAVNEL